MFNKYIYYTISMVVLCLVQHFLMSRLVLFNATPDVLTIFIALASMSLGQKTGTTYGFVSGMIIGFLSGNIGLSALIRTIEGFVAGYCHVPESSHATSTQKKRMFYLATFIALVAGNFVRSVFANPLAQPFILRMAVLVVLVTAMTMIISIGAYHLILKKFLTD